MKENKYINKYDYKYIFMLNVASNTYASPCENCQSINLVSIVNRNFSKYIAFLKKK